MPGEKVILPALKKFSAAVTAKMTALTAGEPEDQLRGPLEASMQEVGHALALKVVSTGEPPDEPTSVPHKKNRLPLSDQLPHSSRFILHTYAAIFPTAPW